MLNTVNKINSQSQAKENNTQECWWMLAGVVDYKLCDRGFDCEHCPFDKILHGTYNLPETESLSLKDTKDRTFEGQTFTLDEMLFYHPAHVWVRVEEGGSLRVGLDDFGQLFGRIYSVTLPQIDSNFRCGEGCWRITHQFGETTLITPVSGAVKQINTKLTQSPSLLNHKPYGEGWAFVIEPAELKSCLKQLFYGQKVKDWHKGEVEKLYQKANDLLNAASTDAGITMPDGGTLKKDFMSELTTEQMTQFINSFFPVSSKEEETSNHNLAILDQTWR